MDIGKASFATLAALGVTGFATTANAALVTLTENLAYNSGVPTDIAIDSTTPQFTYSSVSKDPGYSAYLSVQNSGAIGGDAGTIDPNATYSTDTVKTSLHGVGQVSYLQLSFENRHGVTEYGYASFDSNGSLTSVTYDSVSAVPEPSSWALLIAGAGLTGAVMHRRKRRSVQSALVAA